MFGLESLPVIAEDGRAGLVRDIGEYVTASVIREVRDRLAEVVLSHGGLASPAGRGAAVAFIEGASNRAVARIVDRIEMGSNQLPGTGQLRAIS